MKTIQKNLSLLAALLFSLSLCLSVLLSASAATPFVRDEAGIFDADTLASLEQQAEDAASGHGCDLYFLTVDSIGDQNVRDYAKDYYRANDLGSGDSRSGILFLLAVGSRKYVTITYGGGVAAFTDYRIAQIEEEVVPKLSDGDYSGAAQTFFSLCADTLDFYAEQGEPLDTNNDPDDDSVLFEFVMTVVGSFLIAGIVCIVPCCQMKTAKQKTEANDYMPEYGLRLSRQEDRYLRTRRTQVYDPPSPPPSQSGGGSSTDSDGFGGSSGGSF